MKIPILFLLLITAPASYAPCRDKSVIPLNVERDLSLVTVKIGSIVIPDILLDTGFAFDGLLIYNPAYKDSLDLTNAMEVRIGGAGSGEASRASMVDSAEFSLGDLRMMNQRITRCKWLFSLGVRLGLSFFPGEHCQQTATLWDYN